MRYYLSTYCGLLIILLLVSCNQKQHGKGSQPDIKRTDTSSLVRHARYFTIEKAPDYTEVAVLNPWSNERKVLQKYILVEKGKHLPSPLPEGTVIHTPLERVISFSSVQCGVLAELQQVNTIAGVCEPEYIQKIPAIKEGIEKGTITDLGLAANPNVEKIMLIEPEVILASPLKESGYGHLEKIGLPVLECVDYMEKTPLGRAEWVRFYALFFDQETLADSIFNATSDAYNSLKAKASKVEKRPSVLTETKYGPIWYVPGGQSYAALLLKDAGAAYCWENDSTSGSLSLSFETVLDKAEHADFWLIKHFGEHDMTYKKLKSEYEPYSYFDAFRKRHIYACNTAQAPYYEELPLHPDRVLKDLIRIFHPELLPDHHLRYYKKIED